MTDLTSLLIGLALANYFVLAPMLSPLPLRETTVLPAGLATTISLLPAAVITWATGAWLLEPLGVPELGLLVALLAATAMTPSAVWLRRRLTPASPVTRQSELALTGVNSGLITASLWAMERLTAAASALPWAAATGVGFMMIMMLFAGLRERLEAEEVPGPLRGPAIALVTAGFFALALGGAGSIIRG